MTPAPRSSPNPDDREDANLPYFEIQVEDGRGLLLLRPRTFFGWLRVEHLELLIPDVSFPLDITAGMAQFQHRRCHLLGARLAIDERGLFALISRRTAALAEAGIDELQVRLGEGAIEVHGRARVGEWKAELSARLFLEEEERAIRLVLTEAYTFGYLRRPAVLVGHDLLCVLLGIPGRLPEVTEGERPAVARLGEVVLRPLDLFLEEVLPKAGWRVPETARVVLTSTSVKKGRIELVYAERGSGEVAPDTRREPTYLAELTLSRAGDERLLRQDFAGAVSAYRGEMEAAPESARFLTERILGVLCARDGSLREAEALAEEARLRWPESVGARLALGASAVARGRSKEAAYEAIPAITISTSGRGNSRRSVARPSMPGSRRCWPRRCASSSASARKPPRRLRCRVA